MPDNAWTCPKCDEMNPAYTESCRNCYAPSATAAASPEPESDHSQPPEHESPPASLEAKLRASARFVGLGIALLVVGFSALILGPKGADNPTFRNLVFFAGACEIAAIPLLLIGTIRGLYFSVRLNAEKKTTALVWLFLGAFPLGAILLLLAFVGITYRGP